MKIRAICLVLICSTLLLVSCAGDANPPVAASISPSNTPAQSSESDRPKYIGLHSRIVDSLCDDLRRALRVDIAIPQVDFTDPVTGRSGWGQALTAEGTGEDFTSLHATAQKIIRVLEEDGWVIDHAYQADGPTGTQSGFKKENALALMTVRWEPADDLEINLEQPIEEQDIPAQKILYEVQVILATLPF